MIPKFRAWWIQDEVMTHIDTLEFLQGGIRVSDGCWHEKFLGDEVILMQSTGLIDRNGVEIFEGDIVAIKYSESGYHYYEKIVFENGTYLAGDEDWLYNIKDYCVVCGNIYEDKELLEVEG
ncbi:YopX family protein [Enterococcus avium]|uniref:YopX family protein n=1 Tax=Enterococcus avium TaxID=33945 RepID=UPI003DA26EC9